MREKSIATFIVHFMLIASVVLAQNSATVTSQSTVPISGSINSGQSTQYTNTSPQPVTGLQRFGSNLFQAAAIDRRRRQLTAPTIHVDQHVVLPRDIRLSRQGADSDFHPFVRRFVVSVYGR